jgi:hypothetical protein
MRNWPYDVDGSTDAFQALVDKHFPGVTPDQVAQAIRSETRLIATLGEMISADELAMLAANYHLVGTEDGDFRDALQG